MYQAGRFRATFDQNKAPTGEDWVPLAASTLERKSNRKLLVESAGRIPGSLYWSVRGSVLEVGYSHPLAIFHHSGTTARRLPANPALFRVGGVTPTQGKSKGLPARPLIGFTDADLKEWERIIEEDAQGSWEA